MRKVIILKNDRTGDLFTSLNTINIIFNKHKKQDIEIYMSDVNYKFNFLFTNIKIHKINLNLNLIDKIKILFYFLVNRIDTVYILTPKNFYFYIPLLLFFKKIKFNALCIDSEKKRPSTFLRKFLHKRIIIDRINIKKRKSTYEIQKEIVDVPNSISNLINDKIQTELKIIIPNKSTFFHYKHKMFKNLLNWDFTQVKKFIEFLSHKKEFVIFSSEINNKESDDFFSTHFNTFDFKSAKRTKINSKNILFLKNIDGIDLYTAIKKSSEIIAPEGIITHIGYHLEKKILSLMHFNLNHRQDFINQIISCKEWFPPNRFNYIVLKKNFENSIRKINKRI